MALRLPPPGHHGRVDQPWPPSAGDRLPLMIDLSSPEVTPDERALLAERRVAGVCLFGRNVRDRSQVAEYVSELRELAGEDLVVAVDQEGGGVLRLFDVPTPPAAMALGAADDPDLTRRVAAATARGLRAVGVNLDFAPVADVNSNPANPVIADRSFGADPELVARHVAAFVTGLQEEGVGATLKHFPGHGNTTVDSHTDLPVLTQSRAELDEIDLVPFRAGIAAGAQLVMVGHLDVAAVDPGVPATFSRKVLVDLLRGELGFTGVVISDALNMGGATQASAAEQAVQAILAGNDMLLMPPSVAEARNGLLEAIASGRLPRERLVESVARILTLKFTLDTTARPDMSIVDSPEHQAAAAAIAAAGITVLRGPCTGPLVPGPIQVSTSSGRAQQATWLTEALTAAGVSVVASGGSRVHLVGYGDGPGDLASGAAVTVAMDTPYVLAAADSPVKVATYSSTRAAMQALADVIAGKATAPGRSPVPVDGLPASACVS